MEGVRNEKGCILFFFISMEGVGCIGSGADDGEEVDMMKEVSIAAVVVVVVVAVVVVAVVGIDYLGSFYICYRGDLKG